MIYGHNTYALQDYVATRWYRAPELCGSFFSKVSFVLDYSILGFKLAMDYIILGFNLAKTRRGQ